MRLDVYLSNENGITRSRAVALIKEGRATVNGEAQLKAGYELRPGDAIALNIPAPAETAVLPERIPVRIVYQDADLAVVYKPSGMVVHPAAGNPSGTLVNALLAQLDGLSGIGGELRPGIVHRIDKDTSGLLLVAKNDRAHVFLSEQIGAHTVERAYMAIVQGKMPADAGDIDRPVGRHPSDRKKMAVVAGGRQAFTHWERREELRGATLIEARLKTGRTHQIRVHMASIGHPVLGDPVYGPRNPPQKIEGGQLLHAYMLGFVHPSTGEAMRFTAEPEERFLFWKNKLSL